jgi:hypothetical protein
MSSVTQSAVHGLARDMLRDREQVLRSIIKSLESTQKVESGCRRVLDNWDEYMKNPDNIRMQLHTALKVNSHLTTVTLQVLSVLLVYITSNDFATGAASLMARTGDPQEALREMMAARLREEG